MNPRPLFFGLCLSVLLGAADAFGAGYTLTVSLVGSGNVSRNPTNAIYPAGSTVTLTATPATNWLFSSWTGDETSTANPLNLLMSSNKTVTAHFEPIPIYQVSTSVSGLGSVSLSPVGGSYLSNALVSATAAPAPGWVFVNWSGDASGEANPISLTVNRDLAIGAVFAQIAAIDVPPQNASVGLGDSAAFSVHAVGTAPLGYQWWFAGAPLNGATSTSLSLTNVQSTNEGSYSIVVTNAYGSSTNSALLIITNNLCVGTNVVSNPSEVELRNAITIGGLVRCCFNGTVILSNTIDITHDVTLDAHDRAVVISGNNAVRLFNVSPGAIFSATNVVFAYGRQVGENGADAGTQPAQPGQPAFGGALFCDAGTVRLVGCVLATNSVVGGNGGKGVFPSYLNGGAGGSASGGAIYMLSGSLLLQSVRMEGNLVTGGIGGTLAEPGLLLGPGGDALGGAVYVTNGSVNIENSSMLNNTAVSPIAIVSPSAIGGGIFLASGSLNLSKTSFFANIAGGSNAPYNPFGMIGTPGSGYGGGLGIISGVVSLVQCQFTGNSAFGGGVGRYQAAARGQGGAIYSSGGIIADDSTLLGNSATSGYGTDASSGGGFYNAGTAVLRNCSVVSNRVAGAYGGSGQFPYSGYDATNGFGGGIYNVSQLRMTNCTVALNLAAGGDAPLQSLAKGGAGFGGGVYSGSNATTIAMNVTLASNSVTSGARGLGASVDSISLGANVANTNGTLWLANSVLAYGGTNGNAWGTITDGGFNISSDGSANFQSGASFNSTDPKLLPLANNGGPTPTMALSADSPAVDSGSPAGAPATDQRGLPRPMGLGVDIGAYELASGDFSPPALTLIPQGGTVLLSFTAQPNVFYSLQGSSSLSTWTELEMIGPFLTPTNVTRTIEVQPGSSSFFRLSLH